MSSALPTVEFEDVRFVVGGIRGKAQIRTTGPEGNRVITITLGWKWAKVYRRRLISEGRGTKHTKLVTMLFGVPGRSLGVGEEAGV